MKKVFEGYMGLSRTDSLKWESCYEPPSISDEEDVLSLLVLKKEPDYDCRKVRITIEEVVE